MHISYPTIFFMTTASYFEIHSSIRAFFIIFPLFLLLTHFFLLLLRSYFYFPIIFAVSRSFIISISWLSSSLFVWSVSSSSILYNSLFLTQFFALSSCLLPPFLFLFFTSLSASSFHPFLLSFSPTSLFCRCYWWTLGRWLVGSQTVETWTRYIHINDLYAKIFHRLLFLSIFFYLFNYIFSPIPHP